MELDNGASTTPNESSGAPTDASEKLAFYQRYGPWAAITGAGQGIGAAFAAAVAERGLNLVLVDRDGALLDQRTAELQRLGAQVVPVVVELSHADAPAEVLGALADLDVGLFINNAALSFEGPLVTQGIGPALAQLDINCRATLTFVHALLPRLVARARGGLVLLSSLSAMRGAPLVAGYAATKAWNLILAESLWEEVRADGVDVMAVLPGSTRTPGFMASNPQSSAGTSHLMDPADVATEALEALGTTPSMVPGRTNRESESFMASMERRESIALMGQVMRTMFPAERLPDPTV